MSTMHEDTTKMASHSTLKKHGPLNLASGCIVDSTIHESRKSAYYHKIQNINNNNNQTIWRQLNTTRSTNTKKSKISNINVMLEYLQKSAAE